MKPHVQLVEVTQMKFEAPVRGWITPEFALVAPTEADTCDYVIAAGK